MSATAAIWIAIGLYFLGHGIECGLSEIAQAIGRDKKFTWNPKVDVNYVKPPHDHP